MQKWKVLESHYLSKSPFGNVRQDTVQIGNGRIIEGMVVTEYGEWANVVAITKKGELILVKQYRHGYGDFIIEVPGGSVQDGEPPMDAIVRELHEETGYVSDEQPVKLGSYPTNPALTNNRIHTFLVTNAYRRSEQQLDETEEIEVILVPFERVNQLIKSGEVSQMFTVAAYYIAKERLEQLQNGGSD